MSTLVKYNRQYTIMQSQDGTTFLYSAGAIESVRLQFIHSSERDSRPLVTVTFRNGDTFSWETVPTCVSSYLYQFGISVSFDGRLLFCQTWNRGLFALDARSGEIIWKTQSKSGITNLFINKDNILCCQHEKALQLLNSTTGDVLKELKTTAWGFESLANAHIVCRVRSNTWCLIESSTLEILESFPHRVFTAEHTDYVVQTVDFVDGKLRVRGFKNVWDYTTKPVTRLPNLTFENMLEIESKFTAEE